MVALVPDKIDRSDFEKANFGKLYPNSLDKVRTDATFKLRKEFVTTKTPIKKAANHFDVIFREVDAMLKTWSPNQNVNLSKSLCNVSTRMMAQILFGNSFFTEVGDCTYRNEDGSLDRCSITDMIQKTSVDLDDEFENPVSHHCPYLQDKNIGCPYKRGKANVSEIHGAMNRFLHKLGKFQL